MTIVAALNLVVFAQFCKQPVQAGVQQRAQRGGLGEPDPYLIHKPGKKRIL